jgi:hypothetical protein
LRSARPANRLRAALPRNRPIPVAVGPRRRRRNLFLTVCILQDGGTDKAMSHYVQRSVHHLRRLWLAEAAVVAAILVFGGFALLSDARISPSEFLAGFSQFIPR